LYSATLQQLIKSSQIQRFGNAYTDKLTTQHSVGLKNYELTNHLGNVPIFDLHTGADMGKVLASTGSTISSTSTAVPVKITSDLNAPNISVSTTFTSLQVDSKYEINTTVVNNTTAGPVVVSVQQQMPDLQQWRTISTQEVNNLADLHFEWTPSTTAPMRISYTGGKNAIADNFEISALTVVRVDKEVENKLVLVCNEDENFGDDYRNDSYRYGFNGMEKDNEIKGVGNSLNYKARIQDTRLGRFLSVDPLTSTFRWYTPYQFAGNMPISSIDLDGLEEYYTADGKLLDKYGTSTKVRFVTAKYVTKVANTLKNATLSTNTSAINDVQVSHLAGDYSPQGSNDLAITWSLRYNTQSINYKKEYASAFYEISINGKKYLNYDEPTIGTAREVGNIPDSKNGRTVAYIHSHANHDPDGRYATNTTEDWGEVGGTGNEIDRSEEFSGYKNGDMGWSEMKGKPLYMVSPRGNLNVYIPRSSPLRGTGEAYLLKRNLPSDRSAPKHKYVNSSTNSDGTPAVKDLSK
jgi:RHS repeat-associated protein